MRHSLSEAKSKTSSKDADVHCCIHSLKYPHLLSCSLLFYMITMCAG